MANIDVPEPQLPFDGTDVAVPVDEYLDWYNSNVRVAEGLIDHGKARLRSFLTLNGVNIRSDSVALPLIEADVPVALLRSVELNSDDVVRIDRQMNNGSLLGFAGHASMLESSLSGGLCGSGCDGGNVAVGLWERDFSSKVITGIAFNNTRLSSSRVTSYLQTPTACAVDADCADTPNDVERFCEPVKDTGGCHSITDCPLLDSCNGGFCYKLAKACVQDHLTWVAASVGMVGSYSYNTTVPSGADSVPNVPPGTMLTNSGAYHVSYKVGNDDNQVGLDYLLSQNGGSTPFINRSYSDVRPFIDWAGRAYGAFVTAAAGDNGLSSTVTCASLRNGLCVGWYDYQTTYNDLTTHRRTETGTGLWGSNFVNDSMIAVEVPHLLGPGGHSSQNSGLHLPQINAAAGLNTMEYAYFIGTTVVQIGGSSFSSPAILSAAIQSLQYEGWFSSLAFPMVNKAVLLASTEDANADGQIGKTTHWPQDPGVDAEDGAGQLNLLYVKQILDANQYWWFDLADGDFTSCGTNCRQKTLSLPVPAQKSVRVAMAWQSCLTTELTTPVLSNDLDLVLSCASPCVGTYTSNAVADEIEMLYRPSCASAGQCSLQIRIKNGASLKPCGSTTTERTGIAYAFRP